MSQQQPQKQETRFTVRVDSDLHKAFSDVAKSNDQTPSQLVRAFMREYVAKHRQMGLKL